MSAARPIVIGVLAGVLAGAGTSLALRLSPPESVDSHRIAELERRLIAIESRSADVGRPAPAPPLEAAPSSGRREASRPAVVVAPEETSMKQGASIPEDPITPAVLALDEVLRRTTRQRTQEEVRLFSRRMVDPMVSDLEPTITPAQAELLDAYLREGDGARWLQLLDASERYAKSLTEDDRRTLIVREALASNELQAFLRERLLTREQLRFFPYGRRYTEMHERAPR